MKNFHVFRSVFIQVLILSILLSSSGCLVNYRKFPKDKVGAAPPPTEFGSIYYKIEGVSMAGGYIALQDAFKTKSPFKEIELAEEVPSKGLYVHVQVDNKPPSVPSLIFGYISLVFLTLTPAWSTKGGTDLIFEVYEDGRILKTYDYQIRRSGVLWIVTLPFIWVNLMTYSEVDAFDAVASQFFEDSRPLFLSVSQ